jgi:hypothetical protein
MEMTTHSVSRISWGELHMMVWAGRGLWGKRESERERMVLQKRG